MKTNLLKVLVMTATLFSVGCTKENSSSTSVNTNTSSSSPLSNSSLTNSVNPVGIEITSANDVRTVKVDETLQLTAKVYPETANQNVVWSSSDDSIATVNDGVVTAIKLGNATITATSICTPAVTATCKIVVTKKYVSVTGIALDKTKAEMAEGETLKLTATISPDDATDKTITWTSSNESVATATKNAVTAKKAGKAWITYTVCRKDSEGKLV